MRIRINGQERDVEDGLSVSDLVTSLRLEASSVALAVNGTLVLRRMQSTLTICEGDAIDIIKAMSGG